ncbi:MAG: hypothetical protein IT440_02345 [Phycisphaeraceae bacterium]|nr:hypothetical protein [Phycisphaeraceae bacterium]
MFSFIQAAWRKLLIMAVVILSAGPALAQENLLKNPGFEDAPVKYHNLGGWAFVNHDQPDMRGEPWEQDYHGGLRAVKVTIPGPTRLYVLWAQTAPLVSDTPATVEFSLWYRAPSNAAMAVLHFMTDEQHKDDANAQSVALPVTQSWKQATAKFQVPAFVRSVRVELRADQPGEYFFDDASLVRQDVAFTGKPDAVLWVGASDQVDFDVAGKLPPLWTSAMKDAGWTTHIGCPWDQLHPSLLRRSRLVLLARLPYRVELTGRDRASIKLLQDYVSAGGGLMFSQDRQQMLTDFTLWQAVAKAFGTRILLESMVADKELTVTTDVHAGGEVHTYTTGVHSPFNQDVAGVYYPSGEFFLVYCGALTFVPDAPWKVVLDAGEKSSSKPTSFGLADIDRGQRPEGYASHVPLAGVRDYGQGRVAYIGLNAPHVLLRHTSTPDTEKVYRELLVDGHGERRSGLRQFYLNTFRWLGEKSDALEQATLAMGDLAGQIQFKSGWKHYRGLIGARTTYSTGQSTPDEYVAKARAAGLDFIVFLEDFAALKDQAFDHLKEDCKRLSTPDFLVVPGITYVNTHGNHEWVFSRNLRLPSAPLLDRTCQRLQAICTDPRNTSVMALYWLYSLNSFENVAGWYRFKDNPYPFGDARNVCAMGVVTQEQGSQLVERVIEPYGKTCRDGQMLWPLAINLMTSADDIDHVAAGSAYVNVVGAEGLDWLDKMFNTMKSRSPGHLFPDNPPFGTTYITTGPVIDMQMPRGDTDAEGDIFTLRLQAWPMTLKVTSDAGLKEVRLMDGDTEIRRFLPAGQKEFTYANTVTNERQKYLWVHATDIAGREAISRNIGSNSWLLRENQCADRNNQLLDSRQKRPDGSPFFIGYGGTTTMPDKGPWCSRIRPVGCFIFDQKLGIGAFAYDGAPEGEPGATMFPTVLWNGQWPKNYGWLTELVAGREGAPHNLPRRVVASSDVLVAERVLDGVFPHDAPEIVHVWRTIFPITPSRFLRTASRETFYLVKPDGMSAYLFDQSFDILQDIPLGINPKTPFAIHLGQAFGHRCKQSVVKLGDAPQAISPIDGPGRTAGFNRGDYVGFLKDPFGSQIVYSLTDGLVIHGGPRGYQIGISHKDDALRAGTQKRAKLLFVGLPRTVEDPAALAEQIKQQFGLGVSATGYTVKLTAGSVREQEYQLKLQAGSDGYAAGVVTGLAGLAGNLGGEVHGLNDRWTAFVQVQGNTPETQRTRIMPVEKGIGYCVLQGDLDSQPLFLGHPVIADSPQLVIQVSRSKDWKSWELEVHNPTDKPVTAKVRTVPGILGLTFSETVKLEPGTSVIRSLPLPTPATTAPSAS